MSRYRRQLPGPHRYRDQYGDLYIDGYRYMGRTRVPSMPNRLAMIDRETGDTWVLSHTGDPGSLELDFVARDPRWLDVTLYGPYDGPYFGNYRLFLAYGTLMAEYAPGYGSQTILTRRGFDTTVLQIKVDANTCLITYHEYDL